MTSLAFVRLPRPEDEAVPDFGVCDAFRDDARRAVLREVEVDFACPIDRPTDIEREEPPGLYDACFTIFLSVLRGHTAHRPHIDCGARHPEIEPRPVQDVAGARGTGHSGLARNV